MSDDVITPDLIVSQEETDNRLSFCISCDHNQIINDVPSCDQCNCTISMVTTLSFKKCTIGKW